MVLHLVCIVISWSCYLQVAQSSALTDRQGTQQRILDLEKAVQSVSLTLSELVPSTEWFCNVHSVTWPSIVLCCWIHWPDVYCGVVGAGEAGAALTGVSA